jgi:hypothetical protein
MDSLIEMLMTRAEHLVQRVDGPLNFRLMIMPLVVAFFAVRAGMRDARKGQTPYVRTFLTQPGARARLVRSALKDVGKIFFMAVVLDTTYQLLVLKHFYLGELLFVIMVSAILPYLVIRSAVAILMRRIYRNQSNPANPKEAPKDRMPDR